MSSIDQSNRYPHRHYSELTELITKRENISTDHIILGAGSTELMTTLIHFVKSKGEVLVADPTYFDFIHYAEKSNCSLNKVALNDNFEHDLQAMEQKVTPKTSMIYICNPNNPTGSITPKDKLRFFCERASEKTLVVVDEAYHEYVEDPDYASMIDLVREGKNVVITRTFSKIFGLAGLRIGYGIAKPEIIKDMKRLERNFAPISWLSLQAAIASYNDKEFVQSNREKNKEIKLSFCKELDRLGFFYILSHTNFVLFKINRDARDVSQELEKQQIFVRPFGFHDKHWIRVSLGTSEEMQVFVPALAEMA